MYIFPLLKCIKSVWFLHTMKIYTYTLWLKALLMIATCSSACFSGLSAFFISPHNLGGRGVNISFPFMVEKMYYFETLANLNTKSEANKMGRKNKWDMVWHFSYFTWRVVFLEDGQCRFFQFHYQVCMASVLFTLWWSEHLVGSHKFNYLSYWSFSYATIM